MKKRFAVIGYPLGHTMSPFIHNRLFSLNGISAEYEALLTPPEALADTVATLKKYDGFNITIPHKEAMLSLIDEADESALLYGAVNTVANKNGRLIGYSTDAEGFAAALFMEGIPIKGRVLVCGAGGVSRTIATECVKRGCEVTVAVRPSGIEKAHGLCNDLKERFRRGAAVATLESVCGEYDLLVNGTPVGMHPYKNASVLTEAQLENIKYVFDSVYNPKDTLLVQKARTLGIPAVSGMGMLVMQAVRAQEHWLDVSFATEDIKQLINDANLEMRRIFGE